MGDCTQDCRTSTDRWRRGDGRIAVGRDIWWHRWRRHQVACSRRQGTKSIAEDSRYLPQCRDTLVGWRRVCACVCSSLPTLAVAAGIGLALSTEPSTFVNVMLLSPVNLYVASRVRVLLRERVTQRAIIDASWKPSLMSLAAASTTGCSRWWCLRSFGSRRRWPHAYRGIPRCSWRSCCVWRSAHGSSVPWRCCYVGVGCWNAPSGALCSVVSCAACLQPWSVSCFVSLRHRVRARYVR